MNDRLKALLETDERLAYAVLFGSRARGTASARSDVDVAVGLVEGADLDLRAVGALVSRLESALRAAVDVVVVDRAPPPLAYRVFRDGAVLFERDHAVLTRHRARAILEYLDFRPVEEMCAKGVLAASADGR